MVDVAYCLPFTLHEPEPPLYMCVANNIYPHTVCVFICICFVCVCVVSMFVYMDICYTYSTISYHHPNQALSLYIYISYNSKSNYNCLNIYMSIYPPITMEHFRLPCQCQANAAFVLQETASVLWVQIETVEVIKQAGAGFSNGSCIKSPVQNAKRGVVEAWWRRTDLRFTYSGILPHLPFACKH